MSDSRKWWALAAVGSGTFMSTIDGSIVNIALVTLQDYFQTDLGAVQWVVLAYLLVITCLLLSVGRLGDMIGKRRVYVAGFIVFTIASALCGLSWSIGALIGFRVLQGSGAAMIQAVGPALLITAFPANERGLALGYIGTIVAAGISVGPVVGGLLLRYVGWPSIFFVNVPIGIIAILLTLRALPDDRRRSEQRFDVTGAVLLALALLAVLLALTEGEEWGFIDWRTISLFVGGIALFAGFLSWERRAPAPMINLEIFANRTFSLALLSTFIAFIAAAFNFLLLPFYLQNVLGYDTQTMGLILLSGPLVLSLVAPISGRLSDRVGTRGLAVAGLAALALGLFSLATVTTTSSAGDIVWRLMLLDLGFGLFQSPNSSTIMGSAPRAALGVASSLIAVMRTLGQTAGIAIAGAIWVIAVTAAAGQAYDPITNAPPADLVSGMHTAMIVAGIIAALGIIPALLRGNVPTAAERRATEMPVEG